MQEGAQLARTGWFKRVHMKASATHIDRAALRIRAQLITARTSMANQLRGLLKLFGLRIGTARTPGRRSERLAALYSQHPDLKALFAPLIAFMETIEEQLRASSRLLGERAIADPVCARLMRVPGVGPITALTYTASIEDPRRFAKSDDVGAYAGLVLVATNQESAIRAAIFPKLAIPCCVGRYMRPPTSYCPK